MNIDEKTYYEIENYLLGKLTPEAEIDFRGRMRQDLELRREVKLVAAIIEGTRDAGDDLMTGNRRSRSLILVFGMVAAIALVAAVWIAMRPGAHERLFDKYFVPDPRADLSLGDPEDERLFQDACLAYRQNDFTEAISLFGEFLDKHPNNEPAQYFIAIALLAEGKIAEARSEFMELRQNGGADFDFRKDVPWYLALIELRNGNLDQAKRLLEQITADRENIRGPKARELLDELKEIE